MLQRPDGKFLLQRRSASKDLFPNCWDNSAAGHVDAGEDYETAAKRELAEELGLTDVQLQEQGRYVNTGGWQGWKTNRFQRVYLGAISETPTNLEKGKVDEVRWFSLEEIRQLINDRPKDVSDGLAEVVQRFYTSLAPGEHEPVTVVDDQDNPISTASMPDARALGVIYRVVFVVAKNKKGQVLLQKRSPDLYLYPNCWDVTASGHVDGGRSYEEAAALELEEEVGLHGKKLKEVVHTYTDISLSRNIASRRYAKIYRIDLQETPKNIGAGEVTMVQWFTKQEIDALLAEHPEEIAEGLTLARAQGCL
jgi:16S rRNA (adenine1518-N6/adenine1519-N6)-dimethyltransferase